VVRTLKVGHTFSQGTSDSNQIWLELSAENEGKLIGKSGHMDEKGFVDEWSHFLNSLVLDRQGNRIDRRNAQDIFVPLYSNQQPPGTGQVVHYRLDVPKDAKGQLNLKVRLNYRKFDQTYMNYIYDDLRERGQHNGPNPVLPIALMAEDEISIPLSELESEIQVADSKKVLWQRWRDYGIGLLRQGKSGSNKGLLKQAEEAFNKLVELGRPEGWVDLARLMEKEGRLDDAKAALQKAVETGYDAPWVINWLSAMIDSQNGKQ
jgi:tetratricopeptide (TPR) repeat protein